MGRILYDYYMRASASSLWNKMCTYDFLTNMAEHTIEEKKIRRFVNTGFRVTHSINEDLLNIKRKGDPEVSYPLSYVRYH